MPNVQAPTKASTLTATAVAVSQIPVITKEDVDAAIMAVAEAKAAGKKQREAEKVRDEKLCLMFEKLLGVKSLDEVKVMNADAMAAAITKRMEVKAFIMAEGVDFDVKLDGERRNPKWKEEFVSRLGEGAAKQVEQTTDPTYTWHVIPKQ